MLMLYVDVWSQILKYSNLKDIRCLAKTCKYYHDLLNVDSIVWKERCNLLEITTHKSSCKDKLKRSIEKCPWRWDYENKSVYVKLSRDMKTAYRDNHSGLNPSILGKQTLSEKRKAFKIKINNIGSGVKIGLAPHGFPFRTGRLSETNCDFVSIYYYYSVNDSYGSIILNGAININNLNGAESADIINNNDIIKFRVNKDKYLEILNNGKLIYKIKYDFKYCYPSALLSVGSSISFVY